MVVGISVTLAILVTVVISSLLVALAVARRWNKHVPQLPATEHIYDTPKFEKKLSTLNDPTIYVIPKCEKEMSPLNETTIYDIPKCEKELSTLNETTESGLKEIPVYLTMI